MKNILLILLLAGFVLISSCGKQDEPKDKAKDDSKTEEPKKDNTTSGEQKKDESKDKSNTLNDLGISEGLPKNFPNDIPQPRNSKCLGSLSSSEGTVVNFETSEKIKDLVMFYKDEMKKNGFSISEGGDIMVSDDAAILSWKKNEREFSLIMSFDKEKSMSQIAMTYK